MDNKINTKDMVDVITAVLEWQGLVGDLNEEAMQILCESLQKAIDWYIKESK